MTEDVASPSTSTIPADTYRSGSMVERVIHAAGFSVVGVMVILGSVGLLGVLTGSVSDSANGYTMEVTRAVVTRPGLATPFAVAISAEEGGRLPESVTLEVDSGYLAMFDLNGLQPTPSSSFSRGGSTWWTFDIPAGESSLRVDLDGRLEPAVQWARRGSVALLIDGAPVVTAEFTTWVMP